MIYASLSYGDWLDYGEDVKKYRNAHFEDGWQTYDDDISILFNPKTGEYCKFYVATDKDFEGNDDYNALKGLLTFDYFAGDKEDKEWAAKLFKGIKYHRVINESFDKIVRLSKRRFYCSDAGCFILTANPANVVNL